MLVSRASWMRISDRADILQNRIDSLQVIASGARRCSPVQNSTSTATILMSPDEYSESTKLPHPADRGPDLLQLKLSGDALALQRDDGPRQGDMFQRGRLVWRRRDWVAAAKPGSGRWTIALAGLHPYLRVNGGSGVDCPKRTSAAPGYNSVTDHRGDPGRHLLS